MQHTGRNHRRRRWAVRILAREATAATLDRSRVSRLDGTNRDAPARHLHGRVPGASERFLVPPAPITKPRTDEQLAIVDDRPYSRASRLAIGFPRLDVDFRLGVEQVENLLIEQSGLRSVERLEPEHVAQAEGRLVVLAQPVDVRAHGQPPVLSLADVGEPEHVPGLVRDDCLEHHLVVASAQ